MSVQKTKINDVYYVGDWHHRRRTQRLDGSQETSIE